MIELVSVYRVREACLLLYNLLMERTEKQSISHKKMPTMEEHVKFFHSKPYTAWYLIQNDQGQHVGSIYLSNQREIGVFIFKAHRHQGYGKQAVEELMKKWPGRFLANINPKNEESIKMFESLGFYHIQNTYCGKTGNPYSKDY